MSDFHFFDKKVGIQWNPGEKALFTFLCFSVAPYASIYLLCTATCLSCLVSVFIEHTHHFSSQLASISSKWSLSLFRTDDVCHT